MWEDKGRRTVIINIVLGVLISVLLAALGFTMFRVKRQNEEREAVLTEIQNQQQQQITETRHDAIEALELEYQKDMETVQKYIPGIVCWGDINTLGSYTSISYPTVLQKYIETYITDPYDFSSTIDNPGSFASFRWSKYKFKIPVVNMGAGLEDTNTILGRCGAVPYVVKDGFIIPETTESVPISLVSANGSNVFPLMGGEDGGINEVTIAGVKGVISLDSSVIDYTGAASYRFHRSQAGKVVNVPANTVIETSAAELYKDYIHIVCIGSYGGFRRDPEVLVEQVKTLLERQSVNPERFIVLGVWAMDGEITYSTYSLDAIDEAMSRAFGSRFINVRSYLCGDALSDAGIQKTNDDKNAITNSIVPPSLLSNSGEIELNSTAQKLIGRQIFLRMERLGYFDEIYEELGIEDSVKDIQKKDPMYFERIIESSLG